jgi:acyl-CoA synthetase (AMP-forming)/AMP-acid ligase II
MNLLEALTAAKTASVHSWEDGTPISTPWAEILARGRRMGSDIRSRGLGDGPVACVLTNGTEVLSGMLGIWLAGGAVASLPVPARAMGIEGYAEQLAGICDHLGTGSLLLERPLVTALEEAIAGRIELLPWDALEGPRPCEPESAGEDETAFIQFSSGSTSFPKGCVLTARAIASQLEMIYEVCDLERGDVAGAWLPLSHDMGTFGTLLSSWAFDLDLILSSPARFIRDPRTWFEDCAEFGIGITAGPPAALRAAVRAQATRPLPGPLALRICVLGAEPIGWSTLREANEAYAPFGLAPEVWMPAYGMAEATLMVTSIDADERPSALHLDGAALAEGRIEETAEGALEAVPIVCLGHPQGGCSVRTADPSRVSEIIVSTPSLASGYFGDPVRTAERFRDGELHTGDHGFVRDGQLYVVGREDDMLSIAGRNVFAGEIEAAVDVFDGVRSGCSTVIDVGVDSRSSLVMLLELKREDIDCRHLAAEASRAAKAKAGVLIDECVFLPKGALPKTPSGKIQRFRCRHLLATEEFEPIQRIRLRAVRA